MDREKADPENSYAKRFKLNIVCTAATLCSNPKPYNPEF